MRIQSLAWLLLFAGALAGCALGPEYFTPDAALPVNFVTQPAAKEQQSGGASPELWQWWRTLRDPQLNRLIDRAMANNLDLKIALDRLQQAPLVNHQCQCHDSCNQDRANQNIDQASRTGIGSERHRELQIARSKAPQQPKGQQQGECQARTEQ